VVRPGELTDATALGTIRVAAWRQAYDGSVAREVLDGLDAEHEALAFAARMHADPAIHTLVAVSEGVVIGYCIFGPDRDEPARDRGEVYAVYVHPDHWRSGAGSQLMNAALEELAASGRGEVSLWVLTANAAARDFYTHGGWRPDGAERVLDRLPTPDGSAVREVRCVRRGR
jgi:GNAT superfamily N-acetyltransferase